jgi:membrane protease YdiL (CAAX protease family)
VSSSASPPEPSAPPPGAGAAWSGPAGDQPRTWGPGRVASGIGALLLTTLFEVGVVSAFDPNLDSLAARLVTQALLAVTLVGIAFAVAAGRGGGIASPPALGLRRPLRSPIAMAAATYLGYIVIALVYSALIHPHQEDVTRDLGFGHGAFGTIAAGVLIVVAAPFSEEIFFRGFIFGGLRGRLSFPAAAVFSGVIFGLFHFTGPGSIAVVPQLAFLGFALAWLYEETGSIYPSMAVHAVNNALAFAILTS